jgi:tRNA (guanine-N7-)-methyltransferase
MTNTTTDEPTRALDPSLILRPASWVDPLSPAEIFHRPQPLEVELGAGDGSFLAQWAAMRPDRNFIGVERLLGRLRKLDRKGRRAGLINLRLIRIEASYFLKYLLPPASVTGLHVYFPDPWPKRKHRKNRLVNEEFVTLAHRALAQDGVVWLRTDHTEYFEQMKTVFDASPSFRTIATPPELTAVSTDFEREFNARGILTSRGAWMRLNQ